MTERAYQPLSDIEVQAIARDYYAAREARTLPQDVPTIVLVGAQPGAGKTAAAAAARHQLADRGGYIHIDADRMRERIPLRGVKPTSEQTQADAGRLVRALRGQAVDGRRNLVEEGTFRDAALAAKAVDALRSNGYRVELLAVATNREESVLGIYQRHELLHAAGAPNPRFVAEAYHDEAMHGFDNTVAQLGHQLDRVTVTTRAGAQLYDSAAASNAHATPLEAIAAGRRLDDAKLQQLGEAWRLVIAAAERRAAPPSYLAAAHARADHIADLQKVRTHDHAIESLGAHSARLSADARFSAHSESDLAKAAYYRGIHEKASQFQGATPDFDRYDAMASDLIKVRQLPDVDGLATTHRAERGRDDQDRSL